MTHLSEDGNRLKITYISVTERKYDSEQLPEINDVAIVLLPALTPGQNTPANKLANIFDDIIEKLGPNSTLITIGETSDLVHAHTHLSPLINYQLWIAIKRTTPRASEDKTALPELHFGALVHTKYSGSLNHTKTRIKYTYCPACEKTTKDYGGKKHTYNSYGTLVSDVWRDISADPDENLDVVLERFADLFGIDDYSNLIVLDYRKMAVPIFIAEKSNGYSGQTSLWSTSQPEPEQSKLLLGDVLEMLRKLPDNSVDFAFADPPYNLNKKYNSYSDDLSITLVFPNWITK